VIIAERIAGLIGIAPKPVDFPLINRIHHAIGAKNETIDRRFFERNILADEQTIAINAGASDPIKSFGDIDAIDLDRRRSAGRCLDQLAAKAEAIFGDLVAVPGYMKEY
jgi:hypothetical protein